MFLLLTSPVKRSAEEAILMGPALKATSTCHVRPARLLLTTAEFIPTDTRGNVISTATVFVCSKVFLTFFFINFIFYFFLLTVRHWLEDPNS